LTGRAAGDPHLAAGEAFFLDTLAACPDEALHGPCGLPGWTRAHLVSHVARNADALVNLLRWARTGEETPMYASPAQRDADIEAGATRPAAVVRRDAAGASHRLLEAVGAVPDQAWDRPVRTARGRVVPARQIPWMRVRETWIHAVDLGASWSDLPPSLVEALIDDVAGHRRAAGGADRPLVVRDERSGSTWTIGEGPDPVQVSGDGPWLLAWLAGRSDGSGLVASGGDGRPPPLPPWL
jgi:maleylpyruvate isomerase